MSLRQPLQVLSLSPSGKLLATACGNKINVVDLEKNAILASSDDSTSHAPKCMVRHLVWHTDAKFVSNAEDKHVKEWRIEPATESSPASLVLEQQKELPKRANAISITSDGTTLVIADKFGDVYAFSMFGCSPDLPAAPSATMSAESKPDESVPKPAEEAKEKSRKRRKVGNTGGVAPEWRHVPAKLSAIAPIIGHVSMLTAVMVLQDQGKIITADRDEHIRVSKWPQGWEIERYLLGQKKFVSAIALHPLDSNILIAAGGDDTLRLWDLTTYKCIRKDVSLQPLIGTAEVKIELPVLNPGRRARSTVRRKRNMKGGQQNGDDATPEEDENAPQDEEEQGNEQKEDLAEPTEQGTDSTLARPPGFVPKIRKLDLGITQMVSVGGSETEANAMIVVHSVGSTALLAWSARAMLDTSAEPAHQILHFDSPILSITANSQSRTLWVSFDNSNAPEKPAAQMLRVEDSQLISIEDPTTAMLAEQCTTPVTAEHPYPSMQSLYPDTALLSKDPKDRAIAGGEGEADEGDEEPEEEAGPVEGESGAQA